MNTQISLQIQYFAISPDGSLGTQPHSGDKQVLLRPCTGNQDKELAVPIESDFTDNLLHHNADILVQQDVLRGNALSALLDEHESSSCGTNPVNKLPNQTRTSSEGFGLRFVQH